MDHYSSLNKHEIITSTSPLPDDQDEDSGWTAYFEDFSDNIREESFCSSTIGSSSMVSDAASFPAWKSSQPDHLVPGYSSSYGVSPNIPNKLTFKKTRTKEIYHGDSLEDTASSPVSSPKVRDFGTVETNPRRATNDHFSTSSLGKGSTLDHHGKPEADGRWETDFSGKNDIAELKKRGLCLVPLSMIANYLG